MNLGPIFTLQVVNFVSLFYYSCHRTVENVWTTISFAEFVDIGVLSL